jgi:hypothetical protein
MSGYISVVNALLAEIDGVQNRESVHARISALSGGRLRSDPPKELVERT